MIGEKSEFSCVRGSSAPLSEMSRRLSELFIERSLMQKDIDRTLFHEQTILQRLDQLGDYITHHYEGKELTVVAVLNGSIFFMADLLRRIQLPLRLDCLSVSSYHGGTVSSGKVTFDQSSLPDVHGRHVLVLDDILD